MDSSSSLSPAAAVEILLGHISPPCRPSLAPLRACVVVNPQGVQKDVPSRVRLGTCSVAASVVIIVPGGDGGSVCGGGSSVAGPTDFTHWLADTASRYVGGRCLVYASSGEMSRGIPKPGSLSRRVLLRP